MKRIEKETRQAQRQYIDSKLEDAQNKRAAIQNVKNEVRNFHVSSITVAEIIMTVIF